jgi:hypothetical protein
MCVEALYGVLDEKGGTVPYYVAPQTPDQQCDCKLISFTLGVTAVHGSGICGQCD